MKLANWARGPLEETMDFAQDDLEAYIASSFSFEQQQTINLALLAFVTFSLGEPFDRLSELMNVSETQSSDETQIQFFEVIREGLLVITEKHRIVTTSDAPLAHLVELVMGLYRIANVEDPTPFLLILDIPISYEEKLARMLAELTNLEELRYLDIILQVRQACIDNILVALNRIETANDTDLTNDVLDDTERALVERLRAFFDVFGEKNLAGEFGHSGLAIGHVFDLYLPLLQDSLLTVEEDPEAVAMAIFSVFLMAADTYSDPPVAYKQYSEQILPTQTEHYRQKVESALLAKNLRLTNYMKAQKDQAALSPTPGTMQVVKGNQAGTP